MFGLGDSKNWSSHLRSGKDYTQDQKKEEEAMKVLIIEDEAELLHSSMEYLKTEGYVCEDATTLEDGLRKIHSYNYDCVVADIGLPDGNGLKIVEELRTKTSDAGVIIISARNSLDDKIVGLDIGADDYLTKPFHLSELNARLKSILRRRKFSGNKEIVFSDIRVIPDTLQAFVKDQPVTLTKKEFDLLLYFISNRDRIITKESIAEHLWGDYIDAVDNFDFLYTHICNLRRKLMDRGAPDYIRTIYRVGYKFSGNEIVG